MGHTEHALVAKLVSCARVIQDTQDFSVGTVSTLCQLNSVYQHTWRDVFDVLLDWIRQWHESNRVKGCELGELFLQSTENCLFFFSRNFEQIRIHWERTRVDDATKTRENSRLTLADVHWKTYIKTISFTCSFIWNTHSTLFSALEKWKKKSLLGSHYLPRLC